MISSSFFHTKDCEFNKITFSFLAKVSIIFLFQLFPRTYTIPIYIPKTKPNELEMVHCANNTIGPFSLVHSQHMTSLAPKLPKEYIGDSY